MGRPDQNLSSGCDKTIVPNDSQRLWVPVQDLYPVKLVNIPAQRGKSSSVLFLFRLCMCLYLSVCT